MTAAEHCAEAAAIRRVADKIERAFPARWENRSSLILGVAPSAAAAHAFVVSLADQEDRLARLAEAREGLAPGAAGRLLDGWEGDRDG